MCMCAKSFQLCPTLCDAMDHSLPGFSVHGILQERVLEWVAMPSSRGSSDPGMEPAFLTSPALPLGFFTTSATWKAHFIFLLSFFFFFNFLLIFILAALHGLQELISSLTRDGTRAFAVKANPRPAGNSLCFIDFFFLKMRKQERAQERLFLFF